MTIEPSRDTHKKFKRVEVSLRSRFITFSCYRRQAFLEKDRTRQWFIDSLIKSREKYPYYLWAYVIMPEHVHLVLKPLEDDVISSILKFIKQSVSRKSLYWLRMNDPQYLTRMSAKKSGKESFRFWQHGGGYDRFLRSAEDVHEKVKYCHMNPVKRGLVSQPGDWKWSSYKTWHGEMDVPIQVDKQLYPVVTS